MLKYLTKTIENIAQFIFPAEEKVSELEKLSPTELMSQAKPASLHSIPTIKSLFHYKDPLVQKALWELKYRGNKKIAILFGELLYELILDTISDALLFSNFSEPLLIPLPLSKERKRERGWNQSEMLVKAIHEHDPHALFTINTQVLIKIKHTKPQTTLHRKERLENLKDCFTISNPELIKNKNIILIDDVSTTGSTILEAEKTLRAVGARSVLGFTVAH